MREAPKKYVADLARRWVMGLSTDTKPLIVIATLLDPRYKHYTFRSEGEQRWAETALRNEWQHWKVAQNESTTVLQRGNQPKRPHDFLDDSDDDEEHAPATTDELDLYLSLAHERKTSCVLAWWCNLRLSPPRLAESARQFLATPDSSAGVERLFGAAGLTYNELFGAMTEDTLAQRLLAISNCSPALYIEGVYQRHYLYAEMSAVLTLRWPLLVH